MFRTTSRATIELPTPPPSRDPRADRQRLAVRALAALREAGATSAEPSTPLTSVQRAELARVTGTPSAPATYGEALAALAADADLDARLDLDVLELDRLGLVSWSADRVATEPDPLEAATRRLGLAFEVGGSDAAMFRGQLALALTVVEGAGTELQAAAREMDDLGLAFATLASVRERDGDWSGVLEAARTLSGENSAFFIGELVTTLVGRSATVREVHGGRGVVESAVAAGLDVFSALRAEGSVPRAVAKGAGDLIDAKYGLYLTEIINRTLKPVLEGVALVGQHADLFESLEYQKFIVAALSTADIPEGRRTAVAALLQRAGSVPGLRSMAQELETSLQARKVFFEDALQAAEDLLPSASGSPR